MYSLKACTVLRFVQVRDVNRSKMGTAEGVSCSNACLDRRCVQVEEMNSL